MYMQMPLIIFQNEDAPWSAAGHFDWSFCFRSSFSIVVMSRFVFRTFMEHGPEA